MSSAGRYTDVVLDEKERPVQRGEQPVEYLERDVLLGRVSPEYAGWVAVAGFVVLIFSPMLPLFFGGGVGVLGGSLWWWGAGAGGGRRTPGASGFSRGGGVAGGRAGREVAPPPVQRSSGAAAPSTSSHSS